MPITLPPRDRGRSPDFVSPEATEAVAAWQRAVDAGLIGTRQPLAPEYLANLRRTEAMLRGVRVETP